MERGLIHVYTGNGKGKTTAALGMAMRAAGWGWRVLIIQFMKGGIDYGEVKFIKHLTFNIEQGKINIESFGTGKFIDPKKLTKKDFSETEKALARWRSETETKKWNLIILDEINVAIKFGLIPLEKVLDLINKKPKNLELVLTGRWVSPEIIKLADYVFEIKEIKHPFKKGVSARAGIEY